MREYWRKHPEKVRELSRKKWADPAYRARQQARQQIVFRQRLYGLSYEDYQKQVTTQNGVCAICRMKPETKLVVDHDHATGAIRGLLCRKCNTAIGWLRDDPKLLAAALAYLNRRKLKAA